MISHGNIWHNVRRRRDNHETRDATQVNDFIVPYDLEAFRRLGFNNVDVDRPTTVSWLPQCEFSVVFLNMPCSLSSLDHDLGLIYAHIARFVYKSRAVCMSPISFIANPLSWLDAASHYRAHVLVSPDFGFRLVTKRTKATKTPPSWDLASVCGVMTAAERVQPSTYVEFEAELRPYGYRGMTVPAYGLAEHVVCVCAVYGITISSTRGDVACGGGPNGYTPATLKIVDPDTSEEVPVGDTGEIFVSSRCVAQGYWGKPELSEATFRARLQPDDNKRYLRTGDLGYVDAEGRLYICARIKNMIIINGANFYSDDVEIVINKAGGDSIRSGCCAAFSLEGDDGDECLCVVVEIRENDVEKAKDLTAKLTTSVADAVGLRPRRIVLIKQKTILKTTSIPSVSPDL